MITSFKCQRLRQSPNCVFTRCVRRRTMTRFLRSNTTDIYDPATALFFHNLEGFSRPEERTRDINLHHPLPLLHSQILYRATIKCTRITHENIQSPELVHSLRKKANHLFFIGNIGGDRNNGSRSSLEIFGRVGQSFCITGGNHYRATFFNEGFCNSLAYTRSASSDDCYFSIKLTHFASC